MMKLFSLFLIFYKYTHESCVMSGEYNKNRNFYYNGSAKALRQGGVEIFENHCSMLLPKDYKGKQDIFACCDTFQMFTINSANTLLESLIPNCGICKENIKMLTCYTICSPNQDQFAQVTVANDDPKLVDILTVNISKPFIDSIFESCKNVKFPNSMISIMTLLCTKGSGECDSEKFLKTIFSYSPFTINYNIIQDRIDTEPKPLSCYESYSAINYDYEKCSCQDCEATCLPPPDIKQDLFLVCNYFTIYEFSVVCIYALVMICFFLITCIFKCSRDFKQISSENANKENDKILNLKNKIKNNLKPSFEFKMRTKLRKILINWGYFVATHKFLVGFLSVGILAALSCGILFRFELSSNPVEIWSPPTGEFRQHKKFFDDNFGPFYRIEHVFIKTPKLAITEKNILDNTIKFGPPIKKNIIEEIFRIQSDIENLSITINADESNSPKNVTLSEFCYKPLAPVNKNCLMFSITQYFQNDIKNLDIDADPFDWLTHIHYCSINYGSFKDADYESVSCLSDIVAPVQPNLVFGGFDKNANEANMLIITYVLNNFQNEKQKADIEKWERLFIGYLKNYSHPDIELSFSSDSSLQDEIERQSHTEIKTVSISYIIMFIYVSISLGRLETKSFSGFLVHQKIILGFSGVIIVLLSVTASIGIFCYLGYKINMIVLEVLPFLALAVGVDNIFLLVNEFERIKNTRKSDNVDRMIGETLGNIGHGMLISAVAQVTTFSIGAISNIPAVNSFSLFATAAIAVNFLMQLTLFLVVLTLESQREMSQRLALFCCFKSKSIFTSSQNPPFIQRCFKAFSNIILNRFIKFLLFIASISLWFLSIYTIPSIKLGLNQIDALSTDSYLLQYYKDVFSSTKFGVPVYFIVYPGYRYEDDLQRKFICSTSECSPYSLTSTIFQFSRISKFSKIAAPAESWIDAFYAWLKPSSGQSCCKFLTSLKLNNSEFCPASKFNLICLDCFKKAKNFSVSKTEFAQYLPWFLQDIPVETCLLGGKPVYGKSVVLNPKYYIENQKDEPVIYASSFTTYHTTLASSEDLIEGMIQADKIAKTISSFINHKVVAYSEYYIYYESYFTIWREAGLSFGLSFGAVLLVYLFLFGFDIRMTLLMTFLTFIMIAVEIGLMYLLNIYLNPVSLVNLLMFIGINVEFLSHIGRAYVFSNAPTRSEKVSQALVQTGSSVFCGIAITKLLGIVVLAFSKSVLFQIYYFQMYACAIFVGCLHGLIILPIILSYFGPLNSSSEKYQHAFYV